MANITGALNAGTAGTKIGSAFGPIGSVVGGTVGLLAGLFSSDPNSAALQAQKRYNAEVAKNTAQNLFDRERAQQVERIRTARALQAYQAQGKTQQSTISANYGAADLVGGSARALAQALDFQSKQAEAATLFNYGVNFDNYLININQLTQQGVNSLQRDIGKTQQTPLDLNSAYSAGKQLLAGVQDLRGGNGFSSGLQFGTEPTGRSTGTSDYTLPSNLNLTFKGF